jgi:hypothetical protein
MRQKEFTKEQVRKVIKKVRKNWKSKKLNGTSDSLRAIIGDYQNVSILRHVKEVLFLNKGQHVRNGAKWYLKYPKKSSKKLANKVMKFKNATMAKFPF